MRRGSCAASTRTPKGKEAPAKGAASRASAAERYRRNATKHCTRIAAASMLSLLGAGVPSCPPRARSAARTRLRPNSHRAVATGSEPPRAAQGEEGDSRGRPMKASARGCRLAAGALILTGGANAAIGGGTAGLAAGRRNCPGEPGVAAGIEVGVVGISPGISSSGRSAGTSPRKGGGGKGPLGPAPEGGIGPAATAVAGGGGGGGGGGGCCWANDTANPATTPGDGTARRAPPATTPVGAAPRPGVLRPMLSNGVEEIPVASLSADTVVVVVSLLTTSSEKQGAAEGGGLAATGSSGVTTKAGAACASLATALAAGTCKLMRSSISIVAMSFTPSSLSASGDAAAGNSIARGLCGPPKTTFRS